MPRLPFLLASVLLAVPAGAAQAQSPPPSVSVTTLAAPDAFSTPGRDTGLPPDLWRGASLKTARAVLPLMAARTLSPAAAALARRVLAAGAPGPEGVGADAGLAGARAAGLLAQGDPKAAAAILARAPGADRDPDLARVSAESALLAGDDMRACAVAQGLAAGRDDAYWLRLRTYCLTLAGQAAQAQLTFDLAQGQAKDAVFARLMGVKLAGVGNPGAASLRNGLDYALSKSLGLDLSAAKPSPAVAAAMSGADPSPLKFDIAAFAPDLAQYAQALLEPPKATSEPPQFFYAVALVDESAPKGAEKGRARVEAASLLFVVANNLGNQWLASFAVPEGKAPVGRNLALEAAANGKLMGEAALLVLWTCAEAGAAGPAIGDRIRMVHALHAVGLDAEARAFALEGLLALK